MNLVLSGLSENGDIAFSLSKVIIHSQLVREIVVSRQFFLVIFKMLSWGICVLRLNA